MMNIYKSTVATMCVTDQYFGRRSALHNTMHVSKKIPVTSEEGGTPMQHLQNDVPANVLMSPIH